MSESGDRNGVVDEREDFARLERAVGKLLAERKQLVARASRAEARIRDVEALLRRFTTGDEDPAEWRSRLETLQRENAELRERLDGGRESVERLLARIQFLEESQ
ncbi:MAG: hypothetical protein WD960_11810 [Gemmatimonadota bacterium]